jgi:hypothetical protein
MSKEYFELKESTIRTIDDKQVKTPKVPVDILLQEAEDLFIWCLGDKEALVKVGFDGSLIEDLPVRAGALRYIHSLWQKKYHSQGKVQEEWKVKLTEAKELRNTMLHHFYFAYRNYPDIYAKVRQIKRGNSNAALIQDLSDLAILGNAFPEPLLTVQFDLQLLEQAETMPGQLASLLARVHAEKPDNKTNRMLRDKAYIYLKDAMDEIRRYGQFVFFRDEQKRRGYVSQYYKRQSLKASLKREKSKNKDTVLQ